MTDKEFIAAVRKLIADWLESADGAVIIRADDYLEEIHALLAELDKGK